MADINSLPKEILDVIISFLDDGTKLVSRLASTQWFKQIRYSDYTLHYIRNDHQWEEIATRLSQYNMPISITFPYSPSENLTDLGQLTKLTNLVSLSLRYFHPKCPVETWLALTCLTNLKYLRASNMQIPVELYSKMTRNLTVDETVAPNKKQLLPLMTNLEELYIEIEDGVDDAFELVKSHSRLTFLNQIYLYWRTIKEENTMALSNLKEFAWWREDDESNGELSLRYMTALESLSISIPFHSVTSTRVTNLVVTGSAAKSISRSYPNLSKLKVLDVTFGEGNIESFKAAIASFTALEELRINNSPGEEYNSIYNFVASTNLTSLDLRRWSMSEPITLTSLRSLSLSEVDGKYNYLGLLVNLTKLKVSSETNRKIKIPPSLTNIKYLSLVHTVDIEVNFRLLTNLESLEAILHRIYALMGVENATNLTLLHLYSMSNVVVDFGFLKNLTLLEDLDIAHIICQNFWPNLTGLKNMRSLEVPRMEREDQVLILSNLTNLWLLTTTVQSV
eukprot:TRINITY_DN9474_c0_g1_i1.p1 TRINITY_DN9474_c0_g1~~TRINITY_DN9474_c0_g1_i1.p1  ORF type:complete len:508 (-),score=37.11 TRINITY_DN9474_c0_g1_i1:150-1673(-)